MPETRVSTGSDAGGRFPKLSRLALLGIGAAALPALIGWSIYARSQGWGSEAIRLPLIAAIFWGVTFTFLSWRRLDEGGKEAIKFAFCWGAGPGMMIAATVALVIMYWPQTAGEAVAKAVTGYIEAREPAPGAWKPETTGFVLGIAFTMAIQQMLFVWVWVGWWIRRRLGPQ